MILQGTHDVGLDGDEEVLLRAGVLQDGGEGVFDFGVDSSQDAEEACYGGGAAEEEERLVEGVAS